MTSPSRAPAERPFGEHDYEIVFAPRYMPGQANIRSKAARPLRVGDLYNIDHAGRFYDLVVEEISHDPGGGWNARCKVSDLQWT